MHRPVAARKARRSGGPRYRCSSSPATFRSSLLACLRRHALYFSLGLPSRQAIARLEPALLTIIVVALFSLVFNPWHAAAVALLRLTALMLFAAAVTATTTIGEFIDEITLLARPLERMGLVAANDVGLAVGLVVRFVPEILARYDAIKRGAHRTRHQGAAGDAACAAHHPDAEGCGQHRSGD